MESVEETATTGHALGSREEELMARYVQQTAGIVCVCMYGKRIVRWGEWMWKGNEGGLLV